MTISSMAVGSMSVLCGFYHAIGEGSNIGQLRILHRTQRPCGFAASGAFAIFLVGCEVEGDEEEEVRAENANTGEGSEFLSGAFTRVRHPREVSRGEVRVRCEVNESCIIHVRGS